MRSAPKASPLMISRFRLLPAVAFVVLLGTAYVIACAPQIVEVLFQRGEFTAADTAALALLGRQLKTTCGSGGTVKDGVIEVQGDHCERVIGFLRTQGWIVKRSGG